MEPRLSELKKHLDNVMRNTGWILGGHVWSQMLNPIILVHPSNPGDSLILLACLYVYIGYMKAEPGCKQGESFF